MDNFQRSGRGSGPETDDDAPEVPGYVVGRRLGAGGSATVWLATEERSHRNFALKCFTPGPGDNAASAEIQDSVRRELRILSALDHKHLVKAHEVVRLNGTAGGKFGLVMDFAAGGSVAQLVASRARLSIGETVTILTPIAQALDYLHRSGFVHSDVSPGNVLFSGQGKPLLADLGVTRMVGDPEAVSRHGTPGFADPRAVDALRAGLQPERDVYSVAAIGWYCLTGKAPPLTAHRPPLTLLVPDVPPELAAALESGLNDDRRQRPTAGDFAAAVYRSAKAVPVDLSASVHPTIMPELLTRRSTPGKRTALAGFRGLGRRFSSTARGRQFSRHPRRGRRSSRPAGIAAPPAGIGRSRRLAAPRRRQHFLPLSIALGLVSIVAAVTWLGVPGAGLDPAQQAGQQAGPVEAGQSVADGQPVAAPDAVVPPEFLPAEIVPADIGQLLESDKPEEAVQGLAWVRSMAFSAGRFELLEQVNVKGSPAGAADQKTAAVLLKSGHVLAGFATSLSDTVTEPESTGVRAVVTLTAAASAYEERERSGAVVAVRSAGPAEKLRLVLLLTDGRWHIQEILPAS